MDTILIRFSSVFLYTLRVTYPRKNKNSHIIQSKFPRQLIVVDSVLKNFVLLILMLYEIQFN